MTQEANWASSQHMLGRGRITETICDVLQQRVAAGGRSERPSDPDDLPSRIATRRFLLLNHQESTKNSSKLLHKAQKYMNVEDAIVAKGVTAKRKRDEGTNHNPNKKKETWCIGHALDKKEEPPISKT